MSTAIDSPDAFRQSAMKGPDRVIGLPTPRTQPPRLLSRTRVLRPAIFADDVTGTLAPGSLVAYLGLAPCADDGGYLLWNPTALAATIMPYADPSLRVRELEGIGVELIERGS